MRKPRLSCWHSVLIVGLWLTAASTRAVAQEPSFARQVIPVLSRLGCNAGGGCHGVVLGQGGLRLSLFGGQPALDFERLTHEHAGRRLSVLAPEQSLILLKATGQVAHGGGKRTDVGSSDYQVLRDWIAAGARLGDLQKSALTRLTVAPTEQVLKPEGTGQLQVTATYSDGTSADVTNLCRFEPQDKEILAVATTGQVRPRRVGATTVVVRYGVEPAVANIIVAPEEVRRPFPEVKPHNFIDGHILAKLRALKLEPADLCDDATFLRRLHLDVTGFLPPAIEVRAFLADNDPGKRNRKIDEVLARPGYAEIWAAKFSDLIKPVEPGNDGSNNLAGGQLLRIRFYEWLRARLEENVPYDQLVERLFVSETLEGRPIEEWVAERTALQQELAKRKDKKPNEPLLAVYNQRRTLDLYWERDGASGVGGAMSFAHAFLGLRLQCAQCHRHPYDVWQQDDLLSFANFFTVRRGAPQGEEFANRTKADLQAWSEELKKLGKPTEAADKAKAAELQAKVAGAGGILKDLGSTVAPSTDGKIVPVQVRNALGTQTSRTLRLLGAKQNMEPAAGQDRRQLVIDWLRRPDNPYFARAIVNRVWAHYLGRGLIDPPDNLSPLNPPSHPKLLDELSQGFRDSGHDLRWLHRTILQSRTYQQSYQAQGESALDQANYARFHVRRLQGEVILDVLNQATGARDKYSPTWYFRETDRAVFVAGVMVDVFNYYTQNDPFRYLVFGRQVRRASVQCDCEQGKEVTLPQVFFLANHPEVRQKIGDDNGQVAVLAKATQLDNRQRIEELFLRALGRLPSAAELKAGLEYLEASATLRKGLEDVLWSLLNTREFQLNY